MTHSKPILITTGENAGIGPDIILGLAHQGHLQNCVVIGDPTVFEARAKRLKYPVIIIVWDGSNHRNIPPRTLCIEPVYCPNPVLCGQLDRDNSPQVLAVITRACDLLEQAAAIVTAPVHKSILHRPDAPFHGHTEFFQRYAGASEVVMMLACPEFRVALLTTHIPLRHVADYVTTKNLTRKLQIIHTELPRFFIKHSPRIAVLGLNPHAGEDGLLGTEERDIIEPTLNTLRQQGIQVSQPLPADTAFRAEILQDYDVIFAMYHDQGLTPLKQIGFGQTVNITLGLPFIRTSVDHGTALSLAGTGKADCGSLLCAINTARQMHTMQLQA